MLAVAIEAAQEAGAFVKQNLGKVREIVHKSGQEKNLVTEIDRRSEQMIVSRIRRHFPQHDFLAEEGSGPTGGRSEYKWVVDPLDGTTNFTHGFPVYCVSIGLEYKGEIILGVIYDPNFDELCAAERGSGAYLNGRKIRVSTIGEVPRSLLVTGFPYNIRENPNRAVEHFIAFLMEAQAVRRMGSAAIDLAYVAAGRYEGFWEVSLHPWDMAAGALLVTEAGGTITDFRGNPFSIYGKEILASNGLVHAGMRKILGSP